MKKTIILFAIIAALVVAISYGQIPVTSPPVQEENKVADFKILTTEEVDKINAENKKKVEEEQKLIKMNEEKKNKEAQRLKPSERELYLKLKGNETKYPLASNYYNQYLKLKKSSKRLFWTGLGVAAGGLSLINIAKKPIDIGDYNDYDSFISAIDKQETHIKIGQGLLLGGFGISIIAIPISISAKSNLANAKRLVAKVSINTNGASIAFKF